VIFGAGSAVARIGNSKGTPAVMFIVAGVMNFTGGPKLIMNLELCRPETLEASTSTAMLPTAVPGLPTNASPVNRSHAGFEAILMTGRGSPVIWTLNLVETLEGKNSFNSSTLGSSPKLTSILSPFTLIIRICFVKYTAQDLSFLSDSPFTAGHEDVLSGAAICVIRKPESPNRVASHHTPSQSLISISGVMLKIFSPSTWPSRKNQFFHVRAVHPMPSRSL
jgi:hypothetical protein